MEHQRIIKVIEDFFHRKKQPVLEKIFKEAIKNCGEKINKSQESQEVKTHAKALVETKRPKEQAVLDNLRDRYWQLLGLNYQNPIILSDINFGVESKTLALDEKFLPCKWIDDAAKKASGVSINVTHIAKLTHSSTKASNFNALDFGIQQDKTLVTSAGFTGKLPMDFAYATAEYAPIAEFLQLDCEGKMLGQIICEEPSVLKAYAQNEEQVQQWQEQFKQAVTEKHKSSHILVKQVYFPLSSENDYHLLTPLISSSLAQVIYERIWATRKKEMPVRVARNNNTYHQQMDTMFNKTAILKVTQTNHQNVSNLNGNGKDKRSGQLILLPAIPPQWQTQLKPPIHLKNLFNKQLANQAREPLSELKNLLLAIKANKLSVNLQRKRIISNLVTDIADVVFDHAAQTQGFKQRAGWSRESQLPTYQQYWLDPLREDEEFQIARATLDWPNDVATEFSEWVNRHIKHKRLTLGANQEKQWKKLFVPLLREFNALADADLETAYKEIKA